MIGFEEDMKAIMEKLDRIENQTNEAYGQILDRLIRIEKLFVVPDGNIDSVINNLEFLLAHAKEMKEEMKESTPQD